MENGRVGEVEDMRRRAIELTTAELLTGIDQSVVCRKMTATVDRRKARLLSVIPFSSPFSPFSAEELQPVKVKYSLIEWNNSNS